MGKRAAGILMPISSLPSDYGIGCFSKSAYEFVDWLKEAGQTYWQILPLGPTSYGDSPYQSFSTFAGNPYFIDLDTLVEEGVLDKKDCEKVNWGKKPDEVDYEKIYKGRYPLLRKAYENSDISKNPDYQKFVAENSWWLSDYALFMAVKGRFDNVEWTKWAEDIRLRWKWAMDYYREELYYDIEFQQYMQFKCYEQWMKLKSYANSKGIQIIGDIPIYVALDSADTWAHPELFQFDENGLPTAVAGCPPDAFSATGQLLGNPLYRWDVHKNQGYSWWISRIKTCYELYDMLRIDHFRGFDEYYAIPYGDATAEFGEWEKGPGIELFETLENQMGKLPILAEDLGFLTDSVRKLLADSGFPGMKVLQFAFDSREDSDYLPYHYDRNSVVYTGTHDNATTYSFFDELKKEDKDVALRYMNRSRFTSKKKLTWDLIALAMGSVSDLCIIPAQDYLCLPNSARINTPSTLGGNWKWRMAGGVFDDKLCEKIRKMTKLYGRLKGQSASADIH